MQHTNCRNYMLWIDGVGAWQLCVGRSFVIGAPAIHEKRADVSLMANISRHHATIHHRNVDWVVEAHHQTELSGKTVAATSLMKSGDQIVLAERVKLGFRIPSILSSSAVIDFESHHRPSHSVDGIILMTDHCLLGPRHDHHVCCHSWPELVVLFQQDGQLRCRSKASLSVDGDRIGESAELRSGSVVAGEDIRFRIEQMS